MIERVISNGLWEIVISRDYGGLHLGTRMTGEKIALGMYLDESQIDDLVHQLIVAKKKRKFEPIDPD